MTAAVEPSNVVPASSFNRSRHLGALQAIPAESKAQSAERKGFLITLSGFGTEKGCFRRLRVGSFRKIYEVIGDQLVVLVVRVGPRGKVHYSN